MAQTPEKRVKDSVTKILKAHKAYYFYPVMGGYGRSGIPTSSYAIKASSLR